MSSVTFFDHVILGGGIVGLSIASQLSKRTSSSTSTLLIEKRKALLQETSTHNSGVVHAGLYYPRDSLKTKLCIEGNNWIWENKEKYNIRAEKTGKWIISSTQDDTGQEIEKLHSLCKALEERGMPSRWVSKKERQEKEPELECSECLESMNSGVIDVHSLANFFEYQIVSENDGVILLNTGIKSMKMTQKGSVQLYLDDSMESVVETNCVINSTGLFASQIAQQFRSELLSSSSTAREIPENMKQKLARGSYVTVSGKNPLSRLVYPKKSCPSSKFGITWCSFRD